MERVPLKDWATEPKRVSGTSRWVRLSYPTLRQVLIVAEGSGWLGEAREPLVAGNAYYFSPGDDTTFGSDDGMTYFSFAIEAANPGRSVG